MHFMVHCDRNIASYNFIVIAAQKKRKETKILRIKKEEYRDCIKRKGDKTGMWYVE